MHDIWQINLQRHFGGGEVYTAFFCRALAALGVRSHVLIHPQADFWSRLNLPHETELIRVDAAERLADYLPDRPIWLLSHGPLPRALLTPRHAHWLRTAIAHMPVQGRNPHAFADHDIIYPVSEWVRSGLLAAGLPAWSAALYGVADLDPRDDRHTIHRHSRYDWDRRKGRDRMLGWLEPLAEALRPHPEFQRLPQLTLGIVSRLTPIKQFPHLFAELAPVLARHPQVRLEIFGSGGYASVRDLDRALRPIRAQVRFWGQQRHVAPLYRQLDYLLAGLPEKEALGLNIIEAQTCGLPVLAVGHPPFTETVVDGLTGHFYRDPRQDRGADFERLLRQLQTERPALQPAAAEAHLQRFSFPAFVARIESVVEAARSALQQR